MAKLICLLVLAFAACMVAGLPHQDVNGMLHRTARAADPHPQYYGYNGRYLGGYDHGDGTYFRGRGTYRHKESYRPLGQAYEHCIDGDCHEHFKVQHY